MSRPSIREVTALLADLRAYRTTDDSGSLPDLMARKADLLERIAADRPGDAEAARVAARARTAADRLTADH